MNLKSEIHFSCLQTLREREKKGDKTNGSSIQTSSVRANPSCPRRVRPTCFPCPLPSRALEDPASRRIPFPPPRKSGEDLGCRKWDRLPAPHSTELVRRSRGTPIERLRLHFPFHYRSSACRRNDLQFDCLAFLLKVSFAIIRS